MEYRDFEFWYCRFCQRELDFDYDRSMFPELKAFMDMTVKSLRNIIEDHRERLFGPLRIMSHRLLVNFAMV
ncbi:unnamed protein product [Caenorhabditis nigoni]